MSFDGKISVQNLARKVARLGSCHAFSEVQVSLLVVNFSNSCILNQVQLVTSGWWWWLILSCVLLFCSESGSACHFLLSRVGMRSTTLSTTCGGGDNLLTVILVIPDDHPFEIDYILLSKREFWC